MLVKPSKTKGMIISHSCMVVPLFPDLVIDSNPCLLAYCCPSYSTMASSPAQGTGKVFFLVQPHVAHKLSIISMLFVSVCPPLLSSSYIILVVSDEPDPAGLPPSEPVPHQSLELSRSHATLLQGHIKMIFVSLLLA